MDMIRLNDFSNRKEIIKEKRKASFQIIVIIALILNIFVLIIGFWGVYRILSKAAASLPSNLEFFDVNKKSYKAGVMYLPQLEQKPQAAPVVEETLKVENSEIPQVE